MFFKKIGPKNFWNFAVGNLPDYHSYISEYFYSMFCSKVVPGSMVNKTRQIVFHWWPMNPG